MCGIAGFCDFTEDLSQNIEKNKVIVEKMGHTLEHRGPDHFGSYVNEHVAFAHARLAVIDPAGGAQPMTRMVDGHEYTIVYNGELYNTSELKEDLSNKG